ncbi:thiamine pyrophosphate-requiring protein [Novosphingobium album (ex Liu et al. 2023)]|uniref:Thiamine pyrophosphate-requiring protein n=1 Tax=Novosphingobium album (ex Liu et al. 2023) TaxID=3031130 RepID=A0ABT5WNC1_9SPHN|nr:thiamine pyrophosphate-requiring protein [Novosphingobium album (ex Liu et al. 2023)]MDE8651540.1 thiamine pyrophosphate-requiring protein [Novosphingobium album (ex Liu et al. 2023)]
MTFPQTQDSPAPAIATASCLLLEGLRAIGVEHVFANFGTDHAPIIEEFARWRSAGRPAPNVILCPHESVAVHMAAGFTLATGRSQAVFVHVDSGTANAAMALHNLFRWRVPLLLMAGVAPFTSFGELPGSRDTYVHFIQQPFDQASLVRPYVKWEYTLLSGLSAGEALRRAHTVMNSTPKGPAYLMLPREILTQQWPADAAPAFPAETAPPLEPAGADPAAIEAMAERLLAARDPVLLTSYAGRDPAASDAIARLAALAGIRVVDYLSVHNIGWEFPEFGGIAPGPLDTVDFGLLVDIEVPWIPLTARTSEATFWAQIDVDPIKAGSPLWPFPVHMRLQGRAARILEQLADTIERRAAPDFHAAARARRAALVAARTARLAERDRLAADPGAAGGINPHHFCALLGERLAKSDIVINEAVTSQATVAMQIPRPLPGTMISNPGGGLGASGGVALGVKLARPDARVVQIVGDGTFYFNNPTAVFAVARAQALPILTVVLDNSGWGAVKGAVQRVYPAGIAQAREEFHSRLPTGMDFARTVEAAGGYGEQVADPAAIPAALDRALAALAEGRSALLHVMVRPH